MHEPMWYAVKKSGKGHWAGDRKQTTLWQISSRDQDAETVHGTQKPVECMRRPILNNSSPGQAVYEPFMGSGTTLIAAETTGRVCLGIELNPAYVDVAVERWQRFTGKAAVLDGSGESFADLAASANAEAVDDLALHSAGGAPGGRGRRLLGLSLCSGAGGLDLGLVLACPGYRALGYVEREAYAAAMLVARMEDAALDRAPVWDDVATFDGRPWRGAVDILSCGLSVPAVLGRRPAARRRPTRATSGRTSRASSARSNRRSSSSRTSPIICASDFPRSPETWSAWATGLRQASSRRRKSARRIGASGSSSSPTARVTPTPTQPGFWPTPMAGDSKGTRNRTSGRTETTHRHHDGVTLCDAIDLWPTPQTDSFRSRGGDRRNEKGLDRMARDWPTPMANDGCKPSAGNRGRRPDHVAGMWMTPTARDHKDGSTIAGEHAGEWPAWPPGPGDADGWERYLRCAPDLEPAVRRGADGLAHRVDRLRLCGNGVVPLVAAHALRTLAAELLADG